MQCSRLLATIILGTALGAALTTAPLQAADTAHAAGEGRTMEFVRVSDDGWNFEKQPSGERFVPFGANLIFNYRLHRGQGLHILTQEEWDPDAIRAVFAGAAALHMNVLKVFMTSSGVLTDPQPRDGVRFAAMTPPFLERLDQVFQVARATGVYVSLTFAEWGCHSLRWWQDGGTFLGRADEQEAEHDSFAVLASFWKTLAERYRDEPALLSYNFAVEFYMPGGNWGAHKDAGHDYLLNDRWGLPAWHQWIRDEYATETALNEAWATEYARIDEVAQPEIDFVDGGNWQGHYTMPRRMIADYLTFKECVTYRFLKNQADAIRTVDKRHLLTCGFHPHQPVVGWMGSARYTAGITVRELDFLDYLTTHIYTNPPDYSAGAPPPDRHPAIVGARFMYAGKPVVVEEMGHVVKDREETTRETVALVRDLRGHASGFMLWFLSDLAGEPVFPCGPLGLDLTPNAFGVEWRKLAEPGGLVDTLPRKRADARTILRVDRLAGFVPDRKTAGQNLLEHWDVFPQPVDFECPPNPVLAKSRASNR
jgi:hypothetical protein